MTTIPRIVITLGEPAGIGPDVTIQLSRQTWPAEIVVVGSPELLTTRAKHLNIPLALDKIDFGKPPTASTIGRLKIFPVELAATCEIGKLNSENSAYVIRCLEIATDFCLNKSAHALVTGPIQKSIINDAQIPFTGHTDFLALRAGVKKSIMLFVLDELKVALMTTHIPLSQVATAITAAKLEETLRLLQSELQKKFHETKILVCGLNPHAGESGNLGREEIEVIIPVLEKLRAENFALLGPLSADIIFTEKYWQPGQTILAMYHDQALPVVKRMGFDRAVNVTLGLPFIRTSVDHGTALDIAGTQDVNPGSMQAALKLAIKLADQP